MLFSPDGFLYVSSSMGMEGGIWRFDAQTGNFVDRFAELPNSDASSRFGERRLLLLGPYGDIFAARSGGSEVYRINKSTGAGSVFVPSQSGRLRWPLGMVFDATGNLYVSSALRDQVLRFAPPLPVRVGIEDEEAAPHPVFEHQIFPNPAAAVVTIAYSLPHTTNMTITLYDIQGRQLQRLEDGVKAAGDHTLSVDLRTYPTGLYFYHLQTPDTEQIGRFVIVR